MKFFFLIIYLLMIDCKSINFQSNYNDYCTVLDSILVSDIIQQSLFEGKEYADKTIRVFDLCDILSEKCEIETNGRKVYLHKKLEFNVNYSKFYDLVLQKHENQKDYFVISVFWCKHQCINGELVSGQFGCDFFFQKIDDKIKIVRTESGTYSP